MMAGFVVGLVLLSSTVALADFQSGCEAFERGDYAAAREQWAPLAEHGHAMARGNRAFIARAMTPRQIAAARRLAQDWRTSHR